MSKKTLFKSKKKSERQDVALTKKQEKPEKLAKGYHMKSDFISLGIIISFFILILVGIYYYNQQSDFLIITSRTLLNLFN